jgi:hypothetical protein
MHDMTVDANMAPDVWTGYWFRCIEQVHGGVLNPLISALKKNALIVE